MLGVRHLEATVLSLPLVEGRTADPVLAANIGRFAPASCSRSIPMICSSVNRLGFMSIPLTGDGLYPFLAEVSGLRSYEVAIEDMMEKTSPTRAPWYLIPTNDKLYIDSPCF